MSRPRIVVTGLGLVTALGHDSEACWNEIVRGKCGVGPVDLFDVSPYPGKLGAQIRSLRFLPEIP